MPTVRTVIIDLMTRYDMDDIIAADIWGRDDIIDNLLDADDLPREDIHVGALLDRLHDNVNAARGINWRVIESTISEIEQEGGNQP